MCSPDDLEICLVLPNFSRKKLHVLHVFCRFAKGVVKMMQTLIQYMQLHGGINSLKQKKCLS